ncbi:LysR family transcriptional regulator [Jannaschia sp. Os4]|uniref:LysR family transcriptional regulator n=1 Tax=Jannaschia sp. Os4 TaxID=2807617 RepID=UPI00193ACB3B|nr:LysR family transcriptional regulator [Jannaschia sp. Os4]MBM2575835.1 LysR family transcriptional regulator [Jannaschia sp. Os4]
MDWRDIPSLSALRAFEAAARLGSLSAAARELNVTHAAIAAHVRSLEDFFSTHLMHRSGQGMAVSRDGAVLAQGLTEGFGALGAACRDLIDRNRDRPLAVTTTPSFAENWLMPRIGSFWEAHPEISVSIAPTGNVTDLRRDGYDLAIRYGDGTGWAGVEAEPLLTGDLVVVGDARAARRLRGASVEALRREWWLMDIHRAEEAYLAAHLGVPEADLKVRSVATNGLVLSAARGGLGLALQTRLLVSDALEAGRLHVVAELDLPGVGYYLAHRPGAAPPGLPPFERWLKRAVRADAA